MTIVIVFGLSPVSKLIGEFIYNEHIKMKLSQCGQDRGQKGFARRSRITGEWRCLSGFYCELNR